MYLYTHVCIYIYIYIYIHTLLHANDITKTQVYGHVSLSEAVVANDA